MSIKKIFLLLLLIFLSISTMCQTKYGVRAGMSLSTYYSAQGLYQFKPGVHIGGVAEIPIDSSNFSFLYGVYFADKGTKIKGFMYVDPAFKSFIDNYNYYININEYYYHLEIPLLFTYNIPIDEKLTIKPQLGPFISYALFSKLYGESTYLFSDSFKEYSEYESYLKDFIFSIGGNVGFTAYYKKKYSFTLSSDIGYLVDGSSNNFKNRPDISMFFSLGYSF